MTPAEMRDGFKQKMVGTTMSSCPMAAMTSHGCNSRAYLLVVHYVIFHPIMQS